MPRFRIRFPTTCTGDIIRRTRAGLPREDRSHTGRPGCPCRPCELAARHGEDDAMEERMALQDEDRAAEEGSR